MPPRDNLTRGRKAAARPNRGYNLLASVHVLSNRLTRAFEAELEPERGLSVPEWRVLLSVSAAAGSTAKAVHEQWAMDKMTISRAVRKLVASGRLRRSRNPDDRRSYALELTPKGRRLVDEIFPDADERYRRILRCLSAGERDELSKILAKLILRTESLD